MIRSQRSEDLMEHIPPHSLESERGLISSIVLDPRVYDSVAGVVQSSDFYSPANATLFRLIQSEMDRSRNLDFTIALDRLRESGELEQIGGEAYLAEVLHAEIVPRHAVSYAATIRQKSEARKLIQVGQQLIQRAYGESHSVEDMLGWLESATTAISTGRYDVEDVSMSHAVADALARISAMLESRQTMAIATGFQCIDQKIGGVYPGELTVIGARPAKGKTSFGLDMACHMAKTRRVYFATLEMQAVELAIRRLCTVADVSSQRLRTCDIDEPSQTRLWEAGPLAANDNLLFRDWPRQRVSDVVRGARRAKAEAIFVDYLQLMTPPNTRKERREQVGDVVNGLKAAARELNIPVIALAQIGRAGDRDSNARPTVEKLKESGDIEQTADMVWLIHRPDDGILDARGEAMDHNAELIIAKNRNGATMTLRMTWCAERTKFSSYRESDSWSAPESMPTKRYPKKRYEEPEVQRGIQADDFPGGMEFTGDF